MTKRNARGGRRYHLLVFERLLGMIRLPALLMTLATLALWLVSFRVAFLWHTPGWMYALRLPLLRTRADLLLLLTALGLGLYLFSVFGDALSYVQCRHNHLLVSIPFFRLPVSYKRIVNASPARVAEHHDPTKMSFFQRRFLEGVLAKNTADEGTALLVELTGWPKQMRWARQLMPALMFAPKRTGLLLLVPNWLHLSRELELYRTRWREREIRRRRPEGESTYQMLTKRKRRNTSR